MNGTKSGIYCILNILNNKRYIGSSINIKQRLKVHKSLLKRNKHYSKYLQNSYNKYGIENFKFLIIEYVNDIINLTNREQYYLDFYQSYLFRFGYNACKNAKSPLGFKHSEETKRKLSIINKGRKAWNKGITRTLEEKLAISLGRTGKSIKPRPKCSEEAKKKSSFSMKKLYLNGYINPNKNKPMSEEQKRKLRKPKSESHKEQLRLAWKRKENPGIRILQFDLNGNFIKEWKTIISAQKIYGTSVYACLTGLQKKSYGFIWKYKD